MFYSTFPIKQQTQHLTFLYVSCKFLSAYTDLNPDAALKLSHHPDPSPGRTDLVGVEGQAGHGVDDEGGGADGRVDQVAAISLPQGVQH